MNIHCGKVHEVEYHLTQSVILNIYTVSPKRVTKNNRLITNKPPPPKYKTD